MIQLATWKIPSLILAACLAGTLGADAATTPDVESARKLLEEGLPTIAWSRLVSAGVDENSPEEIRRLFAEACFASGRANQAADVLRSLAAPEPDDHFLLAQCLMATGQTSEAASYYQLAGKEPRLREPAQLGLARALAAQGRHAEAIAILEPVASQGSPRAALDIASCLLDTGESERALDELAKLQPSTRSEFAERDYLTARAALDSGDAEASAQLLQSRSQFPSPIAADAVILQAEALRRSGKLADAENALEGFLSARGNHPKVRQVFAALDGIYSLQDSPSSTALREWRKVPDNSLRSRLANFYLGLNEIRLNRKDRALESFRAFLEMAPDDPLADQARWQATSLLLSDHRGDEALQLLGNHPGALMHFARGTALASIKRYADAAAEFSLALGEFPDAAFNAQLCRILAGEPISSYGPDATELAFARAMTLTQSSPVEAEAALEQIHTSGIEPWASSAALAMAELAYLKLDLVSARRHLRKISNPPTTGPDAPAALEVFLQDDGAPDSADRVINAANLFLAQFPDSPRRGDVSMKMAEVLYRRGDFVAARAQFEKAASESPGTPLAEKARFLSAQAASRSMDPAAMEDAIETYESVARSEGPMASRARFAQALLLNALGRPDEALAVLDNILSTPTDKTLHAAAIIEKGDTLYSLGATNPQKFRQAITSWRELTTESTPPRWRNQALCKIASAEAALGHMDASLATYAEAFSKPTEGEPEYFWYYKAGFEAARLLEENGRHQEAIAVYKKLASDDGPRAQEARDRINRLRLENLLWED
ncbi:MAG: hypothetical protein Fur0032_03010 [Terrimicrobiaceae bacterium]